MLNPNIKTPNGEVTPSEYSEFSQRLENLEQYVPSDAYVSGELGHSFNKWKINLSIRFARGHMAAEATDSDFKKAADEAFNKLHQRIHLWRELRYLEPFHLDSSTEADFFQMLESSEGTRQFKDTRILVVEDDPAALHVMESMFNKLGCQITTASEPATALKEIHSNQYDLIVLDWNLPYLNGGEILTKADQDPTSKNPSTPIILCSSLTKDRIDFPHVSKFYLLEYWDKTLPISSSLQAMTTILQKINRPPVMT